jgi:dTDP-glucose 4,6-dehydratase
MKRILVTGSSGFVGHHFVEHLVKNTDWHIVGINSFRHRGSSRRLDHIPHERFTNFTHDLSAPIDKHTISLMGPIDYVVNFASESHVDRSIDEPVSFIENNVKLILNVLELVRAITPQKFIQISTDEVFGPALDDYCHREWDSALPSNPYAGSKAAQEMIAIAYWRTYGVPLIITNTMNIIGERQDGEKFVPLLISKIMKGEEVTIHGTEGNVGKRFYLHARNQADAILFLLKNHDPKPYMDTQTVVERPDRFNIVGEKELDNLTLAHMVADILGKPLKYKLLDFHAARPGHDRRYALDGSKINTRGWKIPINFEESLKKTVEWTVAHQEWLL